MQFPQENASVDERGVDANVKEVNQGMNNNSIKRESASNVKTTTSQTENPQSNLPLENLQSLFYFKYPLLVFWGIFFWVRNESCRFYYFF